MASAFAHVRVYNVSVVYGVAVAMSTALVGGDVGLAGVGRHGVGVVNYGD